MDPTIITVLTFTIVVSLIGLLALFLSRDRESIESRLNQTNYDENQTIADDPFEFDSEETKGILGVIFPFLNVSLRRQMGERLIRAGLYKRNSSLSYVMFKFLAVAVPVGIGFFAHIMMLATPIQAFLFAAITGILGLIAPGFYLDSQMKSRQEKLRRSLPDALDVIIVCIEGGLSLPASFAKVGSELSGSHPLLATEMIIVQREIQMGRSTGESLKNFAQRFDMEELRSLAGVVLQAEKFGSSVVRAMRIYADGLREKRMMLAEEKAAKAAVYILFPTLFCIFPALFVVILGPAVFDIMDLFEDMGL